MFKIVKVLALTVAMAGMASVSAIAGAEKSPGGTMEHGSMMQNDMQEGEMAEMMKMMQQMNPMIVSVRHQQEQIQAVSSLLAILAQVRVHEHWFLVLII